MARYSGGGGYRGGSSGGRSYRGGSSGGSYRRGSSGRSSSAYIAAGGAPRGRSASSGSGRASGRYYSANTKSFVAGKIAGQYQAKGYSKLHAQRIGNKVVNKMPGTFRSGAGSTRSWTAGVVTGRNQRLYGYGLSRATHIGNAVVRKQVAKKTRTSAGVPTPPTVSGGGTKIANSLARSSSSLPKQSAPRVRRRISKVRFQQKPLHWRATTPPQSSRTLDASRSRSARLTRAAQTIPPAPRVAALSPKIQGWVETGLPTPSAVQPAASKIAGWTAPTQPSSGDLAGEQGTTPRGQGADR